MTPKGYLSCVPQKVQVRAFDSPTVWLSTIQFTNSVARKAPEVRYGSAVYPLSRIRQGIYYVREQIKGTQVT